MNPFVKNQVVQLEGAPFRIVRQVSDLELQLEDQNSGQLIIRALWDLLQAYVKGGLLMQPARSHEQPGRPRQRKPARMDHMSVSAKAQTHRRIDYLVQLERRGSFEKTRKEWEEDIGAIAAIRHEAAPHPATIYKWRCAYTSSAQDVRSLFSRFGDRGGKGQSRLDKRVDVIINDAIEKVFLPRLRSSADDVLAQVKLDVERENANRLPDEQLQVPGLRTIQRRIADISSYDLCVARYGKKEAERRFAAMLGARRVTRILELVEIDHTPVDCLVVNEKGKSIGRPVLTVVLDRHSRCVLGYNLSLAGYGVHAVFAALRHAMLPKTYLGAGGRYADLNLTWDCFGWMELLLMDNGSEFHAHAVADALLNVGVLMEFAKSRQPNDKPYVERFLKTFNYSYIHNLPGTTLARVSERVGFKSEEEACLTLEQLDRMTHVWICDVYHRRPHSGLDHRAPIDVWYESAKMFPPQLKMNEQDLDIEFSHFAESALQHYGIDLNTFVYVSPRLLSLRRMLPAKASVKVKWPSTDAGHVFVWDPLEHEYFRVPNKEGEYTGLTVDQSKAVRSLKAADDPDHHLLAAKGKELIRMAADAAKAGKTLTERKRGARLANDTSRTLRDPLASGAAQRDEQQSPLVGPSTLGLRQEDLFQVEDVEVEYMGEAQ